MPLHTTENHVGFEVFWGPEHHLQVNGEPCVGGWYWWRAMFGVPNGPFNTYDLALRAAEEALADASH